MNFDPVMPNVHSTVPSGHEFRLTAQQRNVLDELERVDARLAAHSHVAHIYRGAIYVIRQTKNPDRFALAAHALREVMVKLAELHRTPIKTDSLKGKVNELRESWSSEKIRSAFEEGASSLLSSKPWRDFLQKLKDFFDWFDQSLPSRREMTGAFFAATDPRQRRLHPSLERAHIDRWHDIYGELSAIAHHGRYPEASDFQQLIDKLDAILIDRLRPNVVEQQEEIDRIIAQGEGRL